MELGCQARFTRPYAVRQLPGRVFFDGTIRLTYLDVQTGEGLAGLSAGGGVPADYAPSDLSAANVCPFTISGARNWVLYP